MAGEGPDESPLTSLDARQVDMPKDPTGFTPFVLLPFSALCFLCCASTTRSTCADSLCTPKSIEMIVYPRFVLDMELY